MLSAQLVTLMELQAMIHDCYDAYLRIIDVRDSITYVEIHNGKGQLVHDALQNKTVKGKIRKVRVTR